MKKKILLSFIITVLCVIAFCTISASAASYGDLTYEVSGHEVTITGCSSSATSVVIPALIEDYPVTTIGESAFENCYRLSEITLPNSIKEIKRDAFYGCALSNVKISNLNAYMTIKFNGFASVPTYLTPNLYIGGNLVTNLEIPEGIIEIPEYIFYGNQSIENVVIPDSVTKIGHQAFMECQNIQSVTIGQGVAEIGYMIFEYCPKLSKITYYGGSSDWDKISDAGYNESWIDNATFTYIIRVDVIGEDGTLISTNYYNDNDKIIYNVAEEKRGYDSNLYYDPEFTQIVTLSAKVTKRMTLYHKYIPLVYLNTFYWNDGSTSIYGEYGGVIVPPRNPKNFSNIEYTYTFSHWDGYTPGMLQQDRPMTFRAVYTATKNKYVYEFRLPNGDSVASHVAEYGTVMEAPKDFVIPEPYIFEGWIGYAEGDILEGNTYIYAKCSYKKYKVTVDGDDQAYEVTYNDPFTIQPKISVNENYEFMGYYLKPNGESTQITDKNGKSIGNYKTIGDITVYPYFKCVRPCTETTVSADGMTFDVTPRNIENGKIVVVALYTGDGFAKMQYEVYNGETIPFTIDTAYSNAKVMVFDSFANLIPVCKSEIIE